MRRSHGIHAGNKLSEQQGDLSPFVERLGRAQNAGLWIDRQSAKQTQQGPAHGTAQKKEQGIADQHGD